MNLTQQEIIDYASRYVSSAEITDFPCDGDLFCLLARKLPAGKILAEEEGWAFQGYNICLGYTLDEESKPAGKWLWMHFASLSSFPPSQQAFKLQPPHVVRGRFQNPGHTHEYRIVKVSMKKTEEQAGGANGDLGHHNASLEKAGNGKIVKFRKKKALPDGRA